MLAANLGNALQLPGIAADADEYHGACSWRDLARNVVGIKASSAAASNAATLRPKLSKSLGR